MCNKTSMKTSVFTEFVQNSLSSRVWVERGNSSHPGESQLGGLGNSRWVWAVLEGVPAGGRCVVDTKPSEEIFHQKAKSGYADPVRGRHADAAAEARASLVLFIPNSLPHGLMKGEAEE